VAEVKFEDNITRKVAIELQKSQVHMNLHRFRGYLAMRYSEGLRNATSEQPLLQVFPIYLLGFTLPDWLPKVVSTERVYRNGLTNELIAAPKEPDPNDPWASLGRTEFVELLTHDARFVQLRHQDYDPNSKVGALLALFDQRRARGHRHFIELDNAFEARAVEDPFLGRALRILQRSCADEQTLSLMALEDEVVSEFDRLENRIVLSEERAERAVLGQKQAEEAASQAIALAKHEKRLADAAEQALQQAKEKAEQAEQAQQQAERDKQQAEQAKLKAQQESQDALAKAARLEEKLRSLGLEP
jgi:hypothetical protein